MNKYEHGNWYCKPSSEAETKEIIDRAVASGAKIVDSIGYGEDQYQWNLFSAWGVFNNKTFTTSNFYSGFANSSKEYTIEQVREKFPLPGELKKPAQWNEEGLPPIGTVCNVLHRAAWENKPSLKECRVIELLPARKIDNGINFLDSAVCLIDTGTCRDVEIVGAISLRPIKTEREKFIVDVRDGYDGGAHHSTVIELAGFIYDAIKSGNLKAPEVDK